ncbi:MAG: DNA-directed RNA polymerase subunit omega [Acidobacteria bacterium]|nr:DNA-directed RNA polymerase subunit omega [Acidobacteriota bacterium]
MKLPENMDSKFRYVLVAASRAEQLMRGAPAKVQPLAGKSTTLALKELKEDLVPWEMGAEPDEAPAEESAADETAGEELN